jgi:hypothetical protein
MSRISGGVVAVVLTGGLAVFGQLPALGAPAAGPSITIAAKSKLKPVTGFVYVKYRQGPEATARIHGSITGAASGDVAKLFARRFPYRKAPVLAGSTTLSSGSVNYSFPVTPTLATRYRVELFSSGSATQPLARSSLVVVYVVAGNRTTGVKPCTRPVCRERLHSFVRLPASVIKRESRKRVYTYFVLALSRTGEPPLPRWLRLDHRTSVGKVRFRSASRYEQTFTRRFTIGNDGYRWEMDWCTKDTETADGIGLPGRHGCGNRRVRSNARYLG